MTGWTRDLQRARLNREPRDQEDRPSARHRRWLARIEEQQRLGRSLGLPVFLNVTTLQSAGAGRTLLGPLRWPKADSPALVWSLWAPRRQVLVDVFPAILPSAEELTARQAFADQHQMTYAIVEPGFQLTVEDLEQLVQPKEVA